METDEDENVGGDAVPGWQYAELDVSRVLPAKSNYLVPPLN